MPSQANPLSTREQVLSQLAQIVGLPLAAARRAADMRTIQFGKLRPVEEGSVGDFALHIQCPWRIEGPDGIITGRSDLWKPLEWGPDIDFKTWDYDTSPNVQDMQFKQFLAQHSPALIVRSVEADDFGGAVLHFDEGFALRWFPAGSRGEDWRLFRPNMDMPHFVISAGAVESEEE
jgi:hypothetical protein